MLMWMDINRRSKGITQFCFISTSLWVHMTFSLCFCFNSMFSSCTITCCPASSPLPSRWPYLLLWRLQTPVLQYWGPWMGTFQRNAILIFSGHVLFSHSSREKCSFTALPASKLCFLVLISQQRMPTEKCQPQDTPRHCPFCSPDQQTVIVSHCCNRSILSRLQPGTRMQMANTLKMLAKMELLERWHSWIQPGDLNEALCTVTNYVL